MAKQVTHKIEGIGTIGCQCEIEPLGTPGPESKVVLADSIFSFDPALPLDFAEETGGLFLEEAGRMSWTLNDEKAYHGFVPAAEGIGKDTITGSHVPTFLFNAFAHILIALKAATSIEGSINWEWTFPNVLEFKVECITESVMETEAFMNSIPEHFEKWIKDPLPV